MSRGFLPARTSSRCRRSRASRLTPSSGAVSWTVFVRTTFAGVQLHGSSRAGSDLHAASTASQIAYRIPPSLPLRDQGRRAELGGELGLQRLGRGQERVVTHLRKPLRAEL